ncbi:MAG TPA: tRNA (adenosine(37)-N6)-threonylcarbamoyltransferase complex dimerization subunit type 1 TsaB [Terriglobales bacterium]|nr:tRNA (adenosine(37)-N6)-threonylcarbamoyltransferase complex dimerization subunit type 1 TsaB [Terriglobales bacterium]
MILLAIDTSGKDGSIALAHAREGMASADEMEILEVVPLEGGTFSAQLVPQIAALLAKHGQRKEDIGGFAVASGPGSFTGLRVGLAAIKALAEILGKPIAAVSRLEAVAQAGNHLGRVIAALDAGRNEIYVGEYDLSKDAPLIGERLVTRDEFLSMARECKVVTPDKSIAEAARTARFEVEEVERPSSVAIAHIGWKKISQGSTTSPEDLEANYIRRTDAEIFAKKS